MKDRKNDVIISGNNVELTEALREAVLAKVARLFSHESGIIRIRVELTCDKSSSDHEQNVARGLIEIKGNDMVVSVASVDMYKSIDLLVDKLDRKIRRHSRIEIVKRKHTHEVDIPASLPKVAVAE
ncbi:MAG: ribosome-associated translation inhibitor RaiA [Opitutales bacterium]|jgi:putative sigma-54 modulation protein